MSYRNHYNGDYNPYTDHPQVQHNNNDNNNSTYQNNPYISAHFNYITQNFGEDANESYLNQHSIPKRQHNDYLNHNNNNNNNANYRPRGSNRGRSRGRGRSSGKRYGPPRHRNRNHRHNHYDQPKVTENIYITQTKNMSEIRQEMDQIPTPPATGNPPLPFCPSPPSQSSGGEIKENIDPVPEPHANDNANINANTDSIPTSVSSESNNQSQQPPPPEPIDYAALVASIEINFNKKQEEEERRKKEEEARRQRERERAARFAEKRAAKQKMIQQQNRHHQSLFDINESNQEDYGYNDYNDYNDYDEDIDVDEEHEEAYEEFLANQLDGSDIDEFDENGAAVGLICEDDMDDSGMERVYQGNMYKLKKNDTLMTMNDEDNTWEAWILYDIDTANGILCLRINGGTKQRQIWSEDLHKEQLYMMKREDMNHTMNDNNTDDSKQNEGGDAAGFRKGFDYSNCMIKDESGLMWRVKEPYDINTAKAVIVNIRNGKSKEAFLNKMVHTLPFN